MKRTGTRIAVLIPAFNAERTIASLIEQIRTVIEPVVVIDDGSGDRTTVVARDAGAVLLHHEVNRGKGAALRTAFAWAIENGFDAMITFDADGQHLPGEIPKLVGEWQRSGADLIIGGRSHLFREMARLRRGANRFSACCISFAAGMTITDSQSGFRLYSADLIRSIQLRSDGFAMESEVIVRAARNGFRIVTIPIELGFVDGVATSHYKPIADTLHIACTVLQAVLSSRKFGGN